MILRKLTFWRVITLIYLCIVGYLCFASPNMLPKVSDWHFAIPADKIVHFCMFAPLPVLLFLCSADKGDKTTVKILSCLIIGVITAGITEIIQGFSPYRSMELLDFAADCLGMAFSCLLLTIFRKKTF